MFLESVNILLFPDSNNSLSISACCLSPHNQFNNNLCDTFFNQFNIVVF